MPVPEAANCCGTRNFGDTYCYAGEDGRPITRRRYDHIWERIGRHLSWSPHRGHNPLDPLHHTDFRRTQLRIRSGAAVWRPCRAIRSGRRHSHLRGCLDRGSGRGSLSNHQRAASSRTSSGRSPDRFALSAIVAPTNLRGVQDGPHRSQLAGSLVHACEPTMRAGRTCSLPPTQSQT